MQSMTLPLLLLGGALGALVREDFDSLVEVTDQASLGPPDPGNCADCDSVKTVEKCRKCPGCSWDGSGYVKGASLLEVGGCYATGSVVDSLVEAEAEVEAETEAEMVGSAGDVVLLAETTTEECNEKVTMKVKKSLLVDKTKNNKERHLDSLMAGNLPGIKVSRSKKPEFVRATVLKRKYLVKTPFARATVDGRPTQANVEEQCYDWFSSDFAYETGKEREHSSGLQKHTCGKQLLNAEYIRWSKKETGSEAEFMEYAKGEYEKLCSETIIEVATAIESKALGAGKNGKCTNKCIEVKTTGKKMWVSGYRPCVLKEVKTSEFRGSAVQCMAAAEKCDKKVQSAPGRRGQGWPGDDFHDIHDKDFVWNRISEKPEKNVRASIADHHPPSWTSAKWLQRKMSKKDRERCWTQ